MHPDLSDSTVSGKLRAGPNPVWLRLGSAFDGEMVQRDFHLVYSNTSILHAACSKPTADILAQGQSQPNLHLPNHCVLPGLIEAHAHLFLEGGECDPQTRAANLQLPAETLLQQAQPRLQRLLKSGIIAVRDAGDKVGVGLALQAQYRTPESPSMPYIDSPGAAIHHKGRYGKFMGEDLESLGGIDAAVKDRVRRGAFRIKLLATGIINFEKGAVTAKPQMSAAELREAVDVADALGKQTMVHCSGHAGAENCIAAGIDTLEHGFFMDVEQLARMRDRNMAWVPTFAPVQFQLDEPQHIGWNQHVCENLKRILDAHAKLLQSAADMDVCVIAGSDAGSHGVPHAHGFFRELELMELAGYPTLSVLRASTARSAERLGFDQPMGYLRKGFLPRFIISDRPVLESVRHLRETSTVVFDGAVYSGGDDAGQTGM